LKRFLGRFSRAGAREVRKGCAARMVNV
jgi:hypothetical protein